VICVYDDSGNVIATLEHAGEFKSRSEQNKKPGHALKRDG
jgi:hypothetical protein